MQRLRDLRILNPLLLASVFFVWFMSNVPYLAYAQAGLDDALFVRGAAYMLAGRWLGPYDDATLAKGPFFSLFIATCRLLNMPIFAAEAALMAGAGLVLIDGLAHWLRSRAALVGIFLLILFSPFTWHAQSLRVVREGIYGPLTLLVVALTVQYLASDMQRLRTRLGWATALGVSAGCFWLTREEGPWIVPGLAGLIGYGVVAGLTRRTAWRVVIMRMVPIGCGLAAAVAVMVAFATANLYEYGVANTVEFRQPEFIGGFNALSRVEADSMPRYVRLTPDALAKAASVSPAAAELWPLLEGERARWAEAGCDTHGISPCDGQFRGGWAVWAVRNAVVAGGIAHTAPQVRAFYHRLDQELTQACSENRIVCGQVPFGILPAPHASDIQPVWHSFLRGLGMLVHFEHDPPQSFSDGRLYNLRVFREMVPGPGLSRAGEVLSVATGFQTERPVIAVTIVGPDENAIEQTTRISRSADPNAIKPFTTSVEFETDCTSPSCHVLLQFADGTVSVPMSAMAAKGSVSHQDMIVETKRVDSTLVARIFPERTRNAVVLAVLNRLAAPYGWAICVLLSAACVGFVIRSVASLRRWSISPVLAIETALLTLVATRLVLLAYLDATGFPGINSLYMSVLYPVVLAFIGISLASTVTFVRSMTRPGPTT